MAAGSGAAAVVHLSGSAVEAPNLKPVPPSSEPTGRPKGALKETSSGSAEQVWQEIFHKLQSPAKPLTNEELAKCSAVAMVFQKVTNELLTVCVQSGLKEQDVRSAVVQNMFRCSPNPQDAVTSDEAFARQDSVGAASPSASPRYNSEGNNAPLVRKEISSKQSLFKHIDGDPAQVYDMGISVGEGSFGSVRKARHRQTGQIHAIKAVPKGKVNPSELWSEIAVMKQLDHPHIMRLYYTFEDKERIYMASEMCSGGELFDTLDETGFFPERIAGELMKQILGAVNYLHTNKQIAHRDLKPENFLVLKRVAEKEMLHLKLIDFGTAKNFKENPLVTKVCTAHYVAPEVLKRGEIPYNEKVDVWSCGVMLYMLLCGFMPFHADDDREILKIVKKGKFTFQPKAVWDKISDDAKDLIKLMINKDPQERCTATEAYRHRWTQKENVQGEGWALQPEDDIVKSMRQFLQHNRLKRVALQIIARQISDDDITKLRNIFLRIDEDQSGSLTIDEMDKALLELEVDQNARQEMAAIMRSIDQNGAGEIEYTEFLAAMLKQEQYLQEDVCRGAFAMLDVDGDGELSISDLKCLLTDGSQDMGKTISKAAMEEIETIMFEIDENQDGGCSFEEFYALMSETQKATASAVSLRWQRGKKEGKVRINADDQLEDEEDGASPCVPVPAA